MQLFVIINLPLLNPLTLTLVHDCSVHSSATTALSLLSTHFQPWKVISLSALRLTFCILRDGALERHIACGEKANSQRTFFTPMLLFLFISVVLKLLSTIPSLSHLFQTLSFAVL